VSDDVYRYVRPEAIAALSADPPYAGLEAQATRFSYAEAIIELAERNPDVVVLDADVSKGVGTATFAERFPERAFNFGISEQNMMAAAAGMATTGLIPYATTYAVFATLRALDQVRNSIHYPRLNVKIAAGDAPGTGGPVDHAFAGQRHRGGGGGSADDQARHLGSSRMGRAGVLEPDPGAHAGAL